MGNSLNTMLVYDMDRTQLETKVLMIFIRETLTEVQQKYARYMNWLVKQSYAQCQYLGQNMQGGFKSGTI